jgi:hypothetical protein
VGDYSREKRNLYIHLFHLVVFVNYIHYHYLLER